MIYLGLGENPLSTSDNVFIEGPSDDSFSYQEINIFAETIL